MMNIINDIGCPMTISEVYRKLEKSGYCKSYKTFYRDILFLDEIGAISTEKCNAKNRGGFKLEIYSLDNNKVF